MYLALSGTQAASRERVARIANFNYYCTKAGPTVQQRVLGEGRRRKLGNKERGFTRGAEHESFNTRDFETKFSSKAERKAINQREKVQK